MSLLPSHHDQFRSKDYWDRFFLERGGEQFEWYGTFAEIEGHISRSVNHTDRILMIGCGNSEISADLFDKNYRTITNLDFSQLVIEEMKSKNAHRPSMKWAVGDMTYMPEYLNESFDIVLDKGALDALMSEDTVEVQEKTTAMFDEISRILTVNGKYICITLAEQYILKKLISYFSSTGWVVVVESLTSKKPSPFKPFYIIITKKLTTNTGKSENKLENQYRLDPGPQSGIKSGTVSLYVDSLGNELAAPRNVLPATAIQEIPWIQEYHQKRFELGEVCVGRFEHMDYMSAPKVGYERHGGEVPRFTVTLLDAARTATRSCVVFFIPSGRESEFQFSTQQGLQGVAEQAQCRRLLAVRCNRPHIFPAMKDLQIELSPIAVSLRPRDMVEEELIPYMALEADGNWETLEYGNAKISGEYIVEEEPDEDRPNGVTRRLIFLQNQNFIQTEIKMIEKKVNKNKSNSSKSKDKKGKTKKQNGNDNEKGKDNDSDRMEFDYSYLDDHHKAVLASLVLTPYIIELGSKVQQIHVHAPSSSSTSTSSTTTTTSSTTSTSGTTSLPLPLHVPIGLIIGLGGGAMPMCMQRYLPGMRLYTCEMDGDMHDIAVKFFAFRCNPRSHVLISEGMSLIERISTAIQRNKIQNIVSKSQSESGSQIETKSKLELEIESESGSGSGLESKSGIKSDLNLNLNLNIEPSEPLDFLFIDADSKDPSLGLSAPPQTFITHTALRTFYQVLRPGGMLALNVVARTVSLFDELLVTVKASFEAGDKEEEERDREEKGEGNGSGSGSRVRERSSVYVLKASDETANTTLIVVKGSVKVINSSPAVATAQNGKIVPGKKKAIGSGNSVSGSTLGVGGNVSVSGSIDIVKQRVARETVIEDWLKAINLPSDPLELAGLIKKLHLA